MSDKYILNADGEAVEEPDLMKWAAWFESADRRLEWTELESVTVSTVFLGIDHGFGDGPPLLFETMVFKNKDITDGKMLEQDCERYSTLEDARAGHAAMIAKWNPQ